jgi:quinolinate synthase
VQDVADYVGDSLGLSRQAAQTPASVIIFAGVHFMAETAAILSPDKRVLLPDLRAGCSLAATITAEDVRQWKTEFPGYVAVGYVNTTAEVKAELDYCCTSGNVLDVIDAIPADKGILFLPDFFLGSHARRMRPDRRIEVWMGECHVHRGIRSETLNETRRLHPDADVLVHPECGCAGQLIYEMGLGDVDPAGLHITSTEGMIRAATESPASEFIVATETGIMHRMQQMAPTKRFLAADPEAVCAYMKAITITGVRDSLLLDRYHITVPPDIAARARLAIDRMVALGR